MKDTLKIILKNTLQNSDNTYQNRKIDQYSIVLYIKYFKQNKQEML